MPGVPLPVEPYDPFAGAIGTATTAPVGTNTTQIATTAFVQAEKFAIDVARYATGGTGTAADPWTGWDTEITWAANHYVFRDGYFAYATAPNWAITGIGLYGMAGTILRHTGTGNAVEFDAGPLTTDLKFRCRFENFVISGNANTTNGLYLRGVHHGTFRNIVVEDVSAAALRMESGVLNVFESFRTSALGRTVGAVVVQPVNGIVMTERNPGETAVDNVFINPIIESVSGTGIHLIKAANNTFYRGTVEAVYGRGVVIESTASTKNRFEGLFCELNNLGFKNLSTTITSAATTATATVVGHGMATGDVVTISGATQAEYNGTYQITVTGVDTFTYTFAGSGTSPATGTILTARVEHIYDNGAYNRYVGVQTDGAVRLSGIANGMRDGFTTHLYVQSGAKYATIQNVLVAGTGNFVDNGTDTIIDGIINANVSTRPMLRKFYGGLSGVARVVTANTYAPTATGTGLGGSPALGVLTGSSDHAGEINIVPGVGAAAAGTVTLTFPSAYGTNGTVVVAMFGTGGGAWNARATVQASTTSTGSVVLKWDNNAVALTNGVGYRIHYIVVGR